MTRLADIDLQGCFATDERLHPDLAGATATELPIHLPEQLFVTAIHEAGARFAPSTTTVPSSRDDATLDARDLPGAEPEETLLPRLDEVLDKYRIEQELGRGGFAVVYRATHLLMRTSVALKLLYPWTLARHPRLTQALCEEARLTSLINHPNVVRVLDVTSTPRFTYIIMEHIDGTTLGRHLMRKPLDVLNTVKVGIHLCQGLDAAWKQGLIHRDIKPGNILISRAGQAKIVDFGLARRADHVTAPQSGPHRIAGTPAYIAPEQATAPDQVDHRADIYALGATLYHAALGRPPFPEASGPMENIMAHLHTPPKPPEQVQPGFHPALAAILMRMLAKSPDERHQTYDELMADLFAIYHQFRPTTPARAATAVQSHEDPGSSSRRAALLGKLKGLFGPKP